jgi:hypothetical protein
MSRENLERLREMFRRAERGDRTAVYAMLDHDVVWEAAMAPGVTGVYRGREEVRQFFRDWVEAFNDYRAESTEFIDAGEHVIVAVRHRGRGKSSGVEVDMPSFQVWSLRAGKVIRYRAFGSRGEALEAVGLAE